MQTLLLIDSHALIHRFFHAMPPLTTPSGEPIGAVYGLSAVLIKILRDVKPTYAAAAFDRKEKTFRSETFSDYKIHRPAPPDALISQFKRARETFEAFHIPIFDAIGFEADDVIGTLVTHFEHRENLQIMILTGDLDLLQLVKKDTVVAEIIVSGAGVTKRYTEVEVMEKYGLSPKQLPDYKGLVGDASDNIPGAKGIGPKTATELMKEFGSLEAIYENSGLIKAATSKKLEDSKKEAIMSKDLATIRRDVPLNIPPLDTLAIHTPTVEKLSPFFTNLGFTSLIRRISE